MSEQNNIAIACQGGGSHTVFTAGVLAEVFEHWDDNHGLVGISGASGSAFKILAAWYGLVTIGTDDAADIVTDLWDDIAATGYAERATNGWLKTLNRFQSAGTPLPQLSPFRFRAQRAAKTESVRFSNRTSASRRFPNTVSHQDPNSSLGQSTSTTVFLSHSRTNW